MTRALALAATLALATPAAADRVTFRVTTAHNVTHPRKKPHKRRHIPPTPRIKPGAAEPFVVPALPEPPDTAAPAEPAPEPAPPLPHTLGVAAKEFRFTLTRTLVGAGAVTIELRNTGEDGHDLHIDTRDNAPVAAWDELPAEAPAVTKTVTLAAGTYRLYCSLPGHAAAGMDTRLTVSAG